MTRIRLATTTVLLLVASCTSQQDTSPDAGLDPDADPVAQSALFVSWNLTAAHGFDHDQPLLPIGCSDAGVVTIRTVSQRIGGAQIVDLFDCADGAHQTGPLAAADYLVWVQALDSADSMVAQSFASEETLFADYPGSVSFTFPVNVGFLSLSWTPVGGSCRTGDGASVRVVPVSGGGSYFEEIFNCSDGSAVTSHNLPVGDLTVWVSHIDIYDDVLGQSSPRSASIQYGNHLVDIGHFAF